MLKMAICVVVIKAISLGVCFLCPDSGLSALVEV